MSKYTTTPWRQPSDLLNLRTALYPTRGSNAPDSRRAAVNRILAWKQRGNLPHAIESTALLLDAVLHHETLTRQHLETDSSATNPDAISTFSLRAVYAAAFCRFVTGFCDIGRSRERSLEPSSMLEIARGIGMPADFVALRHEATHEELPGLGRLVEACRGALGWLWGVYWGRLEGSEGTVEGNGRDEVADGVADRFGVEVGGLLKGWRRGRREMLKGKGSRRKELERELIETQEACLGACRGSSGKVRAMADVVVGEKLLLPTNREMGSPLEGAYLLWDDLLRDFSQRLPDFFSALTNALFDHLALPSTTHPSYDAHKEALAFWLAHLVDRAGFYSSAQQSSTHLAADLLQRCCLQPGPWTQRLGEQLLASGDEDLQDEWQDLFGASLLGGETEGEAGAAEVEDTEMPTAEARLQAGLTDQRPYAAVGGWMRAAAPMSTPIGVVG